MRLALPWLVSCLVLTVLAPAAEALPAEVGPPVCTTAVVRANLGPQGFEACTHQACMPGHPAVGAVSMVGTEGASVVVEVSCGRVPLTSCTATVVGTPAGAAACPLPPVPQVQGEYRVSIRVAPGVVGAYIVMN